LAAIGLALLLYEVRSRKALKFYQTTYTIPNYMSWVIISYVAYIFLSPTSGVMNSIIEFFGGDPVNVYTMPGVWPFILTTVNTWNVVGIRSIIYFAALLSIDPGLFEAARVDGAGRLKQVWYISLPSILPTFMILFILGMRDIFRGDIGLFFNVTRDVGLLYPTTDVLDTYIFRALRAGHFETATAVGLVQSFVGMIMIFLVNHIVKKVSPGNELF
jgi:putative aldouronate transport system permease protein